MGGAWPPCSPTQLRHSLAQWGQKAKLAAFSTEFLLEFLKIFDTVSKIWKTTSEYRQGFRRNSGWKSSRLCSKSFQSQASYKNILKAFFNHIFCIEIFFTVDIRFQKSNFRNSFFTLWTQPRRCMNLAINVIMPPVWLFIATRLKPVYHFSTALTFWLLAIKCRATFLIYRVLCIESKMKYLRS